MMTLALTLAIVAATIPAPTTAPTLAPGCAPATAAFTGTICTPTSRGKHSAILLLGGSEGGDTMSRVAPTFAAKGYVAASVAYFGLPGLPQTVQDVPVETVGNALSAIAKRDDVDPQRIAIFGISKGGELALLAASTYRRIHAVIADVPSPFAWEGIPAGQSSDHESSWTFGGKPVPYLPYSVAIGQAFGAAFVTHAPLALRPAYDDSMKDAAAIKTAMFHLEKIDGPVLFLSAGDDQVWDSVAQARMGVAFLKRTHHAFADESIEYPLAGHLFAFATPARPFVDTPFVGGLTLRFGGTEQTNVRAAADMWPRANRFLETALRAR